MNLFGKTLKQLEILCSEMELPRFTAKQITDWMYKKRVSDFESMTNLSQRTREIFAQDHSLEFFTPDKVESSVDGTKKYLFKTGQHFIETAFIPDEDRKTLCVSSQVGCKMGCLFCMTARQGFQKNLTSGQILGQVFGILESRQLTNIVYMGMGEPLDNLESVLDSLDVLTSDWGLGMSPQRITVSTIGMLDGIKTFFERTRCRFALSLHTPFEDQRKSLMPIQNVYPLTEILSDLRTLQKADERRVSIEYICFAGVNDTPEHSRELVKILHGLKIRVNLIHYHPIPNTPLKGSDSKAMERMQEELKKKGIQTTIRKSRGEDIWAACGLLSTKRLLKPEVADF